MSTQWKSWKPWRFHQKLQGANQVIDAVLLADLAQIDQQVAFALTPGWVGRIDRESAELRAGSHDIDVLRALSAAGDGDLLVTLIGGDDDIGHAETSASRATAGHRRMRPPPPNFARYISGDRS